MPVLWTATFSTTKGHLCYNLGNQCPSPSHGKKANSIQLIGVNVATVVLSQVH